MKFNGFFYMKMALKQCGFMELTFFYICVVLTNVNKAEFSDKPGACPREGVVQWVSEGGDTFTAV